MENARCYLELGELVLPAAVQDGVASYRAHSNPMQEFIDETLEMDPMGKMDKKKLWDIYRQWCNDNGEKSARKGTFRSIMDKLASGEVKNASGFHCWEGFRLPWESQSDPELPPELDNSPHG